MSKLLCTLIAITTLGCPVWLYAGEAKQGQAYFISPRDGDSVSNPIKIVFGLRGMGVAPAGTQVENTGHHHLLINTELPPLDKPIPKDDQHRHFGGGQTEAEITLPPGKHTLQLLLGDFAHVPHKPPVTSERITITVK